MKAKYNEVCTDGKSVAMHLSEIRQAILTAKAHRLEMENKTAPQIAAEVRRELTAGLTPDNKDGFYSNLAAVRQKMQKMGIAA